MRRKPSTWLLKIASASALLPGCADESDDDSFHAPAIGVVILPHYDAGPPMGAVVLPPYPQGTIVGQPPRDAGVYVGAIVASQDAAVWVQGLMPQPQDASLDATQAPGTMPVPPTLDAGLITTPPGDAGPDARCAPAIGPGFILGLLVRPEDAGCAEQPLPGILTRSVSETSE